MDYNKLLQKKIKIYALNFLLVASGLAGGSNTSCGPAEGAKNLAEGLTGFASALQCLGYNYHIMEERGQDPLPIRDHDIFCCRPYSDNDSLNDNEKSDEDADGLANYCDPDPKNPDYDGDGVLDGPDNCPLTPNPDQKPKDKKHASFDDYTLEYLKYVLGTKEK